MFKHILLATDGSPSVERNMLFAAHMARVEQADVVVVHVYEPPERYAGYAGYDELLEHYRGVAQAVVDEVALQLRNDGVDARGEVRTGHPAEAIIAAAHEYDVDLIVMGTRSNTTIGDILGSVSTHVLRHARCPVLQVP